MTWQMIKDHPIVGSGLGAYWIAITKYHHGSGEMTPQQAHNDYLELIADGGLVGVSLLIWFTVLAAKSAHRCLRYGDSARRAVCLGALTGILGIAIHSLVDFGLHVTVNATIFVILIVIATATIPDADAVLVTEH
jgi:O-antigen ligase